MQKRCENVGQMWSHDAASASPADVNGGGGGNDEITRGHDASEHVIDGDKDVMQRAGHDIYMNTGIVQKTASEITDKVQHMGTRVDNIDGWLAKIEECRSERKDELKGVKQEANEEATRAASARSTTWSATPPRISNAAPASMAPGTSWRARTCQVRGFAPFRGARECEAHAGRVRRGVAPYLGNHGRGSSRARRGGCSLSCATTPSVSISWPPGLVGNGVCGQGEHEARGGELQYQGKGNAKKHNIPQEAKQDSKKAHILKPQANCPL